MAGERGRDQVKGGGGREGGRAIKIVKMKQQH